MCYFALLHTYFFCLLELQYEWMHREFGIVGYLPGPGCGDEVLRRPRAGDRREEGQLQPGFPWGAEIQASNPTAWLVDICHSLYQIATHKVT